MSHKKKFQYCPNCGTNVEHANFCPHCGQENHDLHLPAGHLILELLENTLHFDTKLWHSLKSIMTKPGEVTLDFIQGKRAYHIPPFRMYVFIAFVFFLLSTLFADRIVEQTESSLDSHSQSRLQEYVDKIKEKTGPLPKKNRQNLFNTLHEVKTHAVALLPADQSHLTELAQKEYGFISDIWTPDSLDFLALPDTTRSKIVAQTDSTHHRFVRMLGKARENKVLAAQGIVVEADSVTIPLTSGKRISAEKARKLLKSSNEELNTFLQTKGLNPDALHRFALKTQIRWHEAKKKPKDLAHAAIKQLSYAMFFMMPLFALLLKLVYFYRGRFYYEHLIFAVHFHSVLFLFLILLLGVVLWAGNFAWANAVVILLWLGLVVYGFLAFYNVYEKETPAQPYPSVWQGFRSLTFGKKLILIFGLLLLSPFMFFYFTALGVPLLLALVGQWFFRLFNRLVSFRILPKESKWVTVLASIGDREWIEDFFKYSAVLFIYINLLIIAVTVVTALSAGSVH